MRWRRSPMRAPRVQSAQSAHRDDGKWRAGSGSAAAEPPATRSDQQSGSRAQASLRCALRRSLGQCGQVACGVIEQARRRSIVGGGAGDGLTDGSAGGALQARSRRTPGALVRRAGRPPTPAQPSFESDLAT